MAKLAAALGCPPVVLEAGQVDEVASSAASALEMLDGLLSMSDPAYAIRHGGFVHVGFVAAGRHIGVLHVREADFTELVAALRRHFPGRSGSAHGIARPKVRGSGHGYRDLMRRRAGGVG